MTKQLQEQAPVSRGIELYESLFKKVELLKEDQTDAVIKKQLAYFASAIQSFQEKIKNVYNEQSNKTGRLSKVLEEYQAKYTSLIKSLDDSFMLFVIGTGNYGKSTLINSLLEQQLAEVDVLPKTWKIDVFRKDLAADTVVIKYKNNAECFATINEAREIIQKEEEKRKDSEIEVGKKLQVQKKNISTPKAFQELRLKLEREEIYESDIVEMHWPAERSPILQDFYIVDTPGLTQKVMGDVRHNVQDYYHKADGVLWMLDATSIPASNAKKLVENLEESLLQVGSKHPKNIIGVLNRIDLVYNSQGIEGVNQVLADAKRIYKGYFRTIVPFSAKSAFESVVNKDEILKEQSGLNTLYKEIHSAFFQNAKAIQYDKKTQSSVAYNYEVSVRIKQYIKELEADMNKLLESEKVIDKQIQKDVQTLQAYTDNKLKNYRNSVEQNIALKIDQFLGLKEEERQKKFVNNEIFWMGNVENISKDIQKEAHRVLTNSFTHFIRKIYFTEYPHLQEQSNLAIQKRINVNVNVGRDQGEESFVTYGSGIAAGLLASMFLGPLGLLVGGLVGWFAKQGVKDKVGRQLHIELDKLITNLLNEIKNGTESMAEAIQEELAEYALSSFAQVYSFDSLIQDDDLDEFGATINGIIEEGEQVLDILSKPAPDYSLSLKEVLFS